MSWPFTGTRWAPSGDKPALELPQGEAFSCTWGEFVASASDPQPLPPGRTAEERKAKLSGWSSARFRDDYRNSDNLINVGTLTFDVDSDPKAEPPKRGEPDLTPERLGDLVAAVLPADTLWMAHTSPRSRPDALRWRWIVYLLERLAALEYKALVAFLRLALMDSSTPFAVEADPGASMDPARLWFAPAQDEDNPESYHCLSGGSEPLDGRALLRDLLDKSGLESVEQLAEALAAECQTKRAELIEQHRRPLYFERGDEVEMGQRLAASLPGAVFDEGYVYRAGERWTRVEPTELERLAHGYAGVLRKAGKTREGEQKWAPVRLSSGNVKGIVRTAEVVLDRSGFFAERPRGAAFTDTFSRVAGSQIVYEPLSKEHRVRAEEATPWPLPAEMTAPVAHRFLCETWDGCADVEERVRYVFEWLGVALLGLAVNYKESPLLVGAKDTGKSVLLSLLEACFPADSRRAIPLHSLSREYSRASLAGARINCVSELPRRELMDGEAAKALLAGDPVVARHPYGREFTLRSRCAHVFAANELPPAPDAALMGRFVVLDCPNVVPPERQDRGLSARLVEEAPHIAALAIEQVPVVLERGQILRPPSSEALADEWAILSDSVREWAGLSLIPDINGRLPSRKLYDQYRAWALETGHRPLSMVKWARRLQNLRFQKYKSGSIYWCAREATESEVEAWKQSGGAT